jgi:hypothetical protein
MVDGATLNLTGPAWRLLPIAVAEAIGPHAVAPSNKALAQINKYPA